MPYDHKKQQEANQAALDNPQPGDYWQEMFCPYFVVVEKISANKFRVLSCLGGPNSYSRKDEPDVKIDNKDGTWSFDYSKDMIVDRAWMAKAVRYESIDGFVADVSNTKKSQTVVTEWRAHRAAMLRKKWESARDEWEEFTGWKHLKETEE